MLKNNCSLNDEEVFDSAFEGKILCPIRCSVQHCSGCRRVKQHAWEDDEYWFQCCFQLGLRKNCIQEKQSRAMGSCFRRKNRWRRWQIYAPGDWYNNLEEITQEKAKHFNQYFACIFAVLSMHGQHHSMEHLTWCSSVCTCTNSGWGNVVDWSHFSISICWIAK